jgi:hypothetical protein
MAAFINVAMVGEAPRIVNLDLVLDFQLWAPENGQPGTMIRMAVQHNRGAAEGPYMITVKTPFAEIIHRMKNEVFRVGAPPALPSPVATQD